MNAVLLPTDEPTDELTRYRAGRRAALVQALRAVLPTHALLWRDEQTRPYECDGLTAYRERPLAVALPETEEQVAAALRACHALGVPVVARGAGTGLSGGAMPHAEGLTLALAKFNRIVSIDTLARTARVQCGVRNLAISEAAAARTDSGAPTLGWPADRFTRSPWLRWRAAAASQTSIT